MYVRPFTLFSTVHPALLIFYALGAPILAMFGSNPVTMGVMFLCAITVHWFYLGGASTKDGLKGILFVVIFVSVLNRPTTPLGVTELFKIGSRLFTLESMCYGLMNGLMLGTVILWFRCFTAIVPNDKFLYLFGRRFQTAALLLSMILKLFPETRYKIRCIRAAQMVEDGEEKPSLKVRLSRSMRQMSSLLEWSMEDGIETADAMKARGYGEGKRSSYQKYHFHSSDLACLIVMVMLYAAAVFDVVGAGKLFAYYPTLHWEIRKWYVEAAGAVLLVLFLLLPVGTELFRKGGRTS